jgi:hypothetical protein
LTTIPSPESRTCLFLQGELEMESDIRMERK